MGPGSTEAEPITPTCYDRNPGGQHQLKSFIFHPKYGSFFTLYAQESTRYDHLRKQWLSKCQSEEHQLRMHCSGITNKFLPLTQPTPISFIYAFDIFKI